MRARVRMRRSGADCLVVARKWSNVHGAKRAGNPHRNHNGPTGNRRSSPVLVEGGVAALNGLHEPDESRGSRPEFSEGLGVKFPGPTRRPAPVPSTAAWILA